MNDPNRDPADLAAIQACDQVLDEIARGGDPTDHAEPFPTLVGWRQQIDSEPLPELIDVATAQAAIRAGTRRGRRGFRRWVRSVLRLRWSR